MEKQRIYKFDNLKFFLILGIVIEHVFSASFYGFPREIELFWSLFISWLMPLFTTISGYWYKPKKVKETANNYLKPLLFISPFIFCAGYFFYPIYQKGSITIIGFAMWYIFALFIYSNITTLILKKTNVYVLLLLSLVASFCYFLRPKFPSVCEHLFSRLLLNKVFGFFPFYVLGIIYKRYEGSIKKVITTKISIIALSASMLCYVMLCYFIPSYVWGTSYSLANFYLYKILQLTCDYILMTSIVFSIINIAPNKHYWFTKYGSRTMNVYLLHMLVVFPVGWGLIAPWGLSGIKITINSIVCVALCSLFFNGKIKLSEWINNTKWIYIIVVYSLSLLLINKPSILKLLDYLGIIV